MRRSCRNVEQESSAGSQCVRGLVEEFPCGQGSRSLASGKGIADKNVEAARVKGFDFACAVACAQSQPRLLRKLEPLPDFFQQGGIDVDGSLA